MPTKEVVTEEMVRKTRLQFNIVLRDMNECTCESTLVLFVIWLYELSMILITYSVSPGKYASYSTLRSVLPNSTTARQLAVLRNELTHNFYGVDNFATYIKNGCDAFGKENFDYLSKECFSDEINLYKIIMDTCTKLNDKPKRMLL